MSVHFLEKDLPKTYKTFRELVHASVWTKKTVKSPSVKRTGWGQCSGLRAEYFNLEVK